VLGLVLAERERFPDLPRIYFERGPSKSQRLLATYFEALKHREVLDIPDANEAAEFFVGLLMQHWHLQIFYVSAPPPSDAVMREHAEHVVTRFFAMYPRRAH
jgi:hypothetical protein